MKLKTIHLSLIFLLINGCTSNNKKPSNIMHNETTPVKEHLVLAVLWQQNAAEYRALCYQAYNIARYRLNELVKQTKSDKPFAIITDIDETILDNSPYSAQMIVRDENYDKDSWIEWGKRESADLLPGTYDFINYAKGLGVEVFYVSNRYETQLNATINNLKKFGLANADKSHVFLKTTTSGKEHRRKKINETHKVLMLLGDNLSDFDEVYDKQNTVVRNQNVESMKDYFGHSFIVFPNPMYGDWETKGIYDGKYLPENKKRETRIKKLKHH